MTITAIFADHHTLFRQGLAALLCAAPDIELLDYAVTGTEACELIEKLDPDVAILDACLPDMTGCEVASKALHSGLDTRVLVLAPHDDPYAALNAQEAGVAGYVLKDCSFEELATAVATVAAGGTFVSPTVLRRLQENRRRGVSVAPLSRREREVISLIAQGKRTKEIARVLDISPRTVDTYRNRLMDKLQLNSLADIVRYAVRVEMAG